MARGHSEAENQLYKLKGIFRWVDRVREKRDCGKNTKVTTGIDCGKKFKVSGVLDEEGLDDVMGLLDEQDGSMLDGSCRIKRATSEQILKKEDRDHVGQKNNISMCGSITKKMKES
ncbi:hypothetical protein CPB84DRAFT_797166 [Gymnopilus junonius]|uniref:Uncharacterized protein n=1 Tax=Gymnopilus junonius TaxID=109634 RepID=A0A9P5NQN1_GYMJU|nr:hypothetical protein CPB84DRAFT_1752250 [Gymnopilus junonius]KAF8903082.1 hypothetical protein CPB84DRAFT_797166 [Gymnopilus junonius]